MKLLNDVFTGKDNLTFDITRISGASVVATFLGLAIYAVVGKGQPFDPQAYGVGAGAVIAALGVALGFGAKAEPGS